MPFFLLQLIRFSYLTVWNTFILTAVFSTFIPFPVCQPVMNTYGIIFAGFIPSWRLVWKIQLFLSLLFQWTQIQLKKSAWAMLVTWYGCTVQLSNRSSRSVHVILAWHVHKLWAGQEDLNPNENWTVHPLCFILTDLSKGLMFWGAMLIHAVFSAWLCLLMLLNGGNTVWEAVSWILMFNIVTEHRYAESELSVEGDVGKVCIYELIWEKKNGISWAGVCYEEYALK